MIEYQVSKYIADATDKISINDLAGAIEIMNNAIEIDPQISEFYFIRGITYNEIKLYNLALKDLSTAIQLNPEYELAYEWRSTIMINLGGNAFNAFKDCEQALRLNSNNQQAHFNLGKISHNLAIIYGGLTNLKAKEEYTKAINEYTKAALINPHYTDAFYQRGEIWYTLENYKKAINDYSKAIELCPPEKGYFSQTTINLYFKRGMAKYFRRDYDGAILDMNKAIELNPLPYPEAHQMRNDFKRIKKDQTIFSLFLSILKKYF